ncbi:MAG: hypothetical protein A2560_08345, partial [Bdellovibrionales bacterium RIFOXYD1_FULL_39_84]
KLTVEEKMISYMNTAEKSFSTYQKTALIPETYRYLIVLTNFAFSHIWMGAVNKANLQNIFYWIFITLGIILLIASRRRSSSWDAAFGGLAGLFFWAAFGECGKAGELYKTPAVWGSVIVLTIFLMLRQGSRCDFHIFIQKILRIYRVPEDEPHWYALGTALVFYWTVWLGHMTELTAYYDPRFGVHSWLTWAIFIASAGATPGIFYRLWKTHNWAQAWGRAIPSVLISWMAIEILMKWGIFPKL